MHADYSTIRIALSIVGIVLALTYHPAQHRIPLRRVHTAILLVCAAVSFYFYLNLGPQFDNVTAQQITNRHDFYHYYIGAKYHRELGYFDLYECTVVADRQTNRRLMPNAAIRDLRSYTYRRASTIATNPGHCLQAFSPERWDQFKRDIATITSGMRPEYWQNVLRDKGYNATPIWTAYASVITNLLPIQSTAAHFALLGIDYVFVVGCVFLVGWTFGWRHALFVFLFWGVNFATVFGFARGSVSRLDWLLCLIGAVYLLRRGRFAGAGGLAAVATAFRIFPVLCFFGLGSKALWSLVSERRIPRRYLRFVAGFAIVLALLTGASLLGGGVGQWRDFKQKITSHDEQIAGYRLGLKYALIDPGRPKKLEQWETGQLARWSAVVLALGAVFLAARRLPDHLTPGLSFVCVVFLTAPTFYYYEMLVIPLAVFLPDPRRRLLTLGLAAFFGWCIVCDVLGRKWPLGLDLSHRISWSLIGLAALSVALVLVCFRAQNARPETAPTAAGP